MLSAWCHLWLSQMRTLTSVARSWERWPKRSWCDCSRTVCITVSHLQVFICPALPPCLETAGVASRQIILVTCSAQLLHASHESLYHSTSIVQLMISCTRTILVCLIQAEHIICKTPVKPAKEAFTMLRKFSGLCYHSIVQYMVLY